VEAYLHFPYMGKMQGLFSSIFFIMREKFIVSAKNSFWKGVCIL
jgi:hypothetical protein